MKKKCEGCGRLFIPNKRTPNHQRFCTRQCNIKWQKWVLRWYGRIQARFVKMKEEIGCQICGFDECGDALDWHHIVRADKATPIRSTYWYKNSKEFQEELEKCVLLCKNHHYMIDHS